MKRAKDKYMINRTKYKDIKRYDHKQMEDFLTDVYKNGYADGKESVPGVELQDVEKALQDVKGIGPVVWNRIKEIAMPPQNKEIDFGGQTLACPNCGQSAIVNPFRKDREICPYCPWCGQKLKEAEDGQTK